MNWNLNVGFGKMQTHGTEFRGSGKVFVVGDSGTANLSMLSELFRADPDAVVRFVSTIDAAINLCTANAGDLIYVAPGHTENISSASAITCDIAGVKIIGLGEGSDRPTLTWTVVAGTIVVSAANVSFKNFIFDMTGASFQNLGPVTTGFAVTGANFALKDCYVITSDASGRVTTPILVTAVDYPKIEDCKFIGVDTVASSTTATAVKFRNVVNPIVKNNYFSDLYGAAVGAVDLGVYGPGNSSVVDIADNVIINRTAAATVGIVGATNLTGIMKRNYIRVSASGSPSTAIGTTGQTALFQNFAVTHDGQRGDTIGVLS